MAYEVIAKVGQLTESHTKELTATRWIFTWFVELQLYYYYYIPQFRAFCFISFKLGQKVPLNQIMGAAHTVCRQNNWKVMLRHRLWKEGEERRGWWGGLNRRWKKVARVQCRRLVNCLCLLRKCFSPEFCCRLHLSFDFVCQRTLHVTSHTIYMPINLAFSQNKPTTGSCEKNEAEWRVTKRVDSCVFYEGHICKGTNQITVNVDTSGTEASVDEP